MADNLDFNVEGLQDVELGFADPNEKAAVIGDLVRTRIVVLNEDAFPNRVETRDTLPVLKGFVLHNYYAFTKQTHWGKKYVRTPPSLDHGLSRSQIFTIDAEL